MAMTYKSTNEAIEDSYTSSSSLDNLSMNVDEHCVQKRKARRVRCYVESSIEEITDDPQTERMDNVINTRPYSTNSLIDKRPFPFGQCRVCMDKATGAHYGVPTCEGCKGFFKRSILRKEKYRCYFGDRCIITTDNRNRCKSCRFHKCLKEGMSIEGVRMGRIPKLVKEKALAEHHLSSSSIENDDPSSSNASLSPPCSLSLKSNSNNFIPIDLDLQLIDDQLFLDGFDLFPPFASYASPDNSTIDDREETLSTSNNSVSTNSTINREEHFTKNVIERIQNLMPKISHFMTYTELNHGELSFIEYLRWKMLDLCNVYNVRLRQLTERMNRMMNLGIKNFPGDHSTLQDILTGLTNAIPSHVKNLITFARDMPAINEIDLDDFHKIMNNRLFDFWMIKHAPLLCNNESYIMLRNGLQYTRQWMNKIIGEKMVQTMFEFAKKFNALNLTQEEHALIFPVVICVKDKTLNDQETVQQIQCCYLYALRTQMLTTRTQIEAKTVFSDLLQVLAFLPLLNELQEEEVDSPISESMEPES